MQNNIGHRQPIKKIILDYFNHLYNLGESCSVLKSSKGALSQILFLPPKFMYFRAPTDNKIFKGVYNLRLPTQKITFVWDVKILFDYFSHKGESEQLSDKKPYTKL